MTAGLGRNQRALYNGPRAWTEAVTAAATSSGTDVATVSSRDTMTVTPQMTTTSQTLPRSTRCGFNRPCTGPSSGGVPPGADSPSSRHCASMPSTSATLSSTTSGATSVCWRSRCAPSFCSPTSEYCMTQDAVDSA